MFKRKSPPNKLPTPSACCMESDNNLQWHLYLPDDVHWFCLTILTIQRPKAIPVLHVVCRRLRSATTTLSQPTEPPHANVFRKEGCPGTSIPPPHCFNCRSIAAVEVLVLLEVVVTVHVLVTYWRYLHRSHISHRSDFSNCSNINQRFISCSLCRI